MFIEDFVTGVEKTFPLDRAEEYDRGRIGLVIEGDPEISGICCALDVTASVIQRAVSSGANLLVVHHTPLWNPLTRIRGLTAKLLRPIMSANMNIYVLHTNLDHAEGGVNTALADLLSLSLRDPLSLGLVGTCTLTIPEIASRLNCSLRLWGVRNPPHRLAIVGGSGFTPDLLREAYDAGADTFLSSELRHSEVRSTPLPCIEATHYALEAPAMRQLAFKNGWIYLDDPPVQSVVP